MSRKANETADLEPALRAAGMWRAATIDCPLPAGIPSGFAGLDKYLPGNGWPLAGITEILLDEEGIGELRLLAPALAHLSQTQNRWLLWVSPPHIPYAPALAKAGIDLNRILVTEPGPKDFLWVLEKALGSKSCSAVLAWPEHIKGHIRDKEIRRLQVASKEGHCLGLLFRPGKSARQASPAELRVQLLGNAPLDVRIIKRRGGWPTDTITIALDDERAT